MRLYADKPMHFSKPHTASYYAATRNEIAAFPVLGDEVRCDVCVVGAGFTGIATALTLAERGYNVTVLEQNKVGWGASGRNGGQMLGGIPGEARLDKVWGNTHADFLFELGYCGHDIIARRVHQYGIDCDLRYGAIDVALRSRQVEQQKRMHEALCARGMENQSRLVSADDLRELLGTDKYLGGLINMRNGHLHPLNLCLGEARAAAGLGVSIYEGSEVTGIEHGDSVRVRTRHGAVRADNVVLAGNAYQHLEPSVLTGLVFPAGSYIVATEPLSPEEVAQINPQSLAVCDMNEVPDYFRLSAENRLLFGGRCNYSGREPRDIEKVMLPRLREIYPQLAHKRVDYAWGGKIGIVVNRVPLMGRIGTNVFYALGYSGHGVSLSHAFGEVLADAVTGTSGGIDVFAGVPHRKIPFGQELGSQIVALGMLYFRLRDLL
ncbi:Gamma-glutamylputrescine oxidoreductase [Halioglobus japonicus]|nr:Gamma-glutamylputrescine oxidoreductase [Halioglobus japonicus]